MMGFVVKGAVDKPFRAGSSGVMGNSFARWNCCNQQFHRFATSLIGGKLRRPHSSTPV